MADDPITPIVHKMEQGGFTTVKKANKALEVVLVEIHLTRQALKMTKPDIADLLHKLMKKDAKPLSLTEIQKILKTS